MKDDEKTRGGGGVGVQKQKSSSNQNLSRAGGGDGGGSRVALITLEHQQHPSSFLSANRRGA